MNERIKELDKQAKLWAIDNTNFPISSHIPAGYTEKFAELIVKDCENSIKLVPTHFEAQDKIIVECLKAIRETFRS